MIFVPRAVTRLVKGGELKNRKQHAPVVVTGKDSRGERTIIYLFIYIPIYIYLFILNIVWFTSKPWSLGIIYCYTQHSVTFELSCYYSESGIS